MTRELDGVSFFLKNTLCTTYVLAFNLKGTVKILRSKRRPVEQGSKSKSPSHDKRYL